MEGVKYGYFKTVGAVGHGAVIHKSLLPRLKRQGKSLASDGSNA